MSKLYEALQQAKGDRPVSQPPIFVDPAPAGVAVGLDIDIEMLGLYRSLDNVFPGLHQKVILFLGAKGGEGASTVVSNLARVAAERLNRKVAVLDADTLHPAQHRLFGVSPTVGWDDVLRGAGPAEKAFCPTNSDRLWLVPVSSARAGTVQVIDAPGMEGLFGALRERFDLILIDGAPATVFPDSITLSRKADGVVLVIEAESTRCPVANTIHQQITNAGGRVIGVVFNKRRYYVPEFVYQRL
jgi:Mrp family chromosome partitioning ATPase